MNERMKEVERKTHTEHWNKITRRKRVRNYGIRKKKK
jgi:hypothetical protein